MGLAAAQLLASRGASISLADLNAHALLSRPSELPGGSERHMATVVDVRDAPSVDAWIAATMKRYGKLTAAVNMAGVLGPSGPMTDMTDDQFSLVWSVNVVGVFNCLRAQLRVMQGGSIVR